MRIYISGPMTGLPQFNTPAFNSAATRLADAGFEPINPARHGLITGFDWVDYMRLALMDLARSEAVALLPGWRHSRGALLEVHVADQLGLERHSVVRWLFNEWKTNHPPKGI